MSFTVLCTFKLTNCCGDKLAAGATVLVEEDDGAADGGQSVLAVNGLPWLTLIASMSRFKSAIVLMSAIFSLVLVMAIWRFTTRPQKSYHTLPTFYDSFSVSAEIGDRVRVQFPVPDIYFGM